MKKKMIRILCVFLSLFLLGGSLAGCSGVNTKNVVSYKGDGISCAVFEYLCCTKKTDYLYEAYGTDSSGISADQLQDNQAIWSASDASGTTVADALKGEVLQELQTLLFLKNYAEEKGYTLSAEQKKLVKQDFDALVYRGFDDKRDFNAEMKKYGADYDSLLEFNYLQSLAYQGNELLFGEQGTMKVSEDTARNYYTKNYMTVSTIFLNTQNKKYPNGKVVVLPADEKAEKVKLADQIEQKLQSGEDFDALRAAFSDESDAAATSTFLTGTFAVPEVEEKAKTLSVGEVSRVDVAGGTYFVRRLELNKDFFSSEKEAILSQLQEVKKYMLVADAAADFKLNETYLNSLDIAALSHVV